MDQGAPKGFSGIWERIVPEQEPSVLRQLLIFVVCIGVAILVRLPFEPFLGGELPYATFFPAVLAATLLAGGVAGALVVVIGCPIALVLFGGVAAQQAPVASVLIWLVNGGIVLVSALGVRHLVRSQRVNRAALEASQQKLTTMLHEFDHRTRNAFSLIQAISNQTAKSSRSINDYKDRLHDRITTLAAAKTWLLTHPGEAAGLSTVVDMALRPFLDERADQIAIAKGPDCLVSPGSCTSLTLALHELATNAAKYGALSTPDGRVKCGWRLLDGGDVEITWRENGGPHVVAPDNGGFGTTLIRNALAAEEGRVSLEFRPDGVACEMRFAPAQPCAPEPAMAG
jgi:two-component sensor histidine kinase